MSKKFRNGLFGFNREDVMDFVVESREKEAKLKTKCEELTVEIEKLSKKLDEAKKYIEEFKQREEALTRLSESIGRLYLVAQANASAVTKAAQENAVKSAACVDSNMKLATETELKLEEIGIELTEKTKKYLEDIEILKTQLAEAREHIDENQAVVDERISETSSIVSGK